MVLDKLPIIPEKIMVERAKIFKKCAELNVNW